MPGNARVRRRLSSLRHDKRGVTAILFALLAIPLVLAVGMAVDLGIAYYMKTRLSYAVDAAALAVGSTVTSDTSELIKRGTSFVNANYPANALGTPENISVKVVNDTITVSADVTFDTFFLGIVGQDTITVSAESEVIRNIKGLQVAMVLDVTGSMRTNTTPTNIAALRTAAEDFVDILFGSYTTHPHLEVALVPYSSSVNPGPEAFGGNTSPPAPSWWPTSPGSPSFTYDGYSGTQWKGCVFERTGTNRMGDSSSTGWTPYSYPPDKSNNYRLNNITGTIRFDQERHGNNASGPNLGCPSPIIPLTNDKTTLVNEIRALDAWERGGTLGDIGMAWGRRVLSPQAPFTTPVPYNDPDWDKAIVMMTDGENTVYNFTGNYGWNGNKEEPTYRSDLTGYGWLSSSNPQFGTNSAGKAQSDVNTRLANLCTDIKNNGITIYTITFTSSISPATKQIYQNCASKRDDGTRNWFDSPTQADLKATFRAIAIELSRLRVSN